MGISANPWCSRPTTTVGEGRPVRQAARAGGGYRDGMSEQSSTSGSEESDARQEAAEHVVDRVESWDEGAEPETIREDLEEGMAQAEVEVDERDLDQMATQIHDQGSTDTPEVG